MFATRVQIEWRKKVSKSDKDFFVLILPFTERRTAEDKNNQRVEQKRN